jgi:hypothetical protein
MNFLRRFLVVIFFLSFLIDLFLWTFDFDIGTPIPIERKWTYRITALALITLTILTHKYLRKKYIDWLAKIWLNG